MLRRSAVAIIPDPPADDPLRAVDRHLRGGLHSRTITFPRTVALLTFSIAWSISFATLAIPRTIATGAITVRPTFAGTGSEALERLADFRFVDESVCVAIHAFKERLQPLGSLVLADFAIAIGVGLAEAANELGNSRWRPLTRPTAGQSRHELFARQLAVTITVQFRQGSRGVLDLLRREFTIGIGVQRANDGRRTERRTRWSIAVGSSVRTPRAIATLPVSRPILHGGRQFFLGELLIAIFVAAAEQALKHRLPLAFDFVFGDIAVLVAVEPAKKLAAVLRPDRPRRCECSDCRPTTKPLPSHSRHSKTCFRRSGTTVS